MSPILGRSYSDYLNCYKQTLELAHAIWLPPPPPPHNNQLNSQREAIFNRLEDIFSSGSASESSSTPPAPQQFREAKRISSSTSDKGYRKLTAGRNITSYSKLGKLHECPRLYELEMLSSTKEAAPDSGVTVELAPQTNLDFAYGHSVGAGIQTFMATKNLLAAQFAAFLAWRAPYDSEKLDARGNPSGKSLAWALYAVEKFEFFYTTGELADWDVLVLHSGKQAVELGFAIDTGNGYFHVGHIDIVLIHRETKRLAVWEGKTTGYASIKEATYGNSYQALGYSVVVDALSQQLNLPTSDYEVFYVVYSSKEKQFQLLPFTKTLSQRAEWLQDLLLDHAMLDKYQELKFYPKRGESCINKYGRQCEWYSTCGMKNSSLFPGVELQQVESVSEVLDRDYTFTLAELIAGQQPRTPNNSNSLRTLNNPNSH